MQRCRQFLLHCVIASYCCELGKRDLSVNWRCVLYFFVQLFLLLRIRPHPPQLSTHTKERKIDKEMNKDFREIPSHTKAKGPFLSMWIFSCLYPLNIIQPILLILKMELLRVLFSVPPPSLCHSYYYFNSKNPTYLDSSFLDWIGVVMCAGIIALLFV